MPDGDKETLMPVVPGIDADVIVDLCPGRQMRLKTLFLQGQPQEEVDQILDRIFRSLDRQKAKYELPDLEKEMKVHEKALRQLDEDMQRIGDADDKRSAERDAEIAEVQNQKIALLDDGQKRHLDAGKRTPYKPQGHTMSEVDRLSKAIGAYEAEREKAKNERTATEQNMVIQRKRFCEEIERIADEIVRRRSALGA